MGLPASILWRRSAVLSDETTSQAGRLTLPLLLMLFVALLGAPVQAQQPPEAYFDHLMTDQGLSAYPVTSIVQDPQGFIWVGTVDGLNRYDGYAFTVYRHEAANLHSMSDNFVSFNALYEHRGHLWIGTRNGLNRFDPTTGRFERFLHDPADSTSLSHNIVEAILATDANTLWIGTNEGLCRLDLVTQEFTRYYHVEDDPHSLSRSGVMALTLDAEGTLWVGTRSGLNRYDARQDRFLRYQHEPGNPQSLPFDDITTLYSGSGGYLWIGTEGGGLIRFHKASGQFQQFLHDPARESSLGHNEVIALLEDRRGILWVGTWGEGLCRHEPGEETFSCYTKQPRQPHSLVHDQVSALLEDDQGNLWIGTWNGVSKKNIDVGFTVYPYDPDDPDHSISHPRVSAIYQDPQSTLWIGTLGGGLNKLDRATGTVVHYRNNPQAPGSLSHDEIWSITGDEDQLWIGTGGGGLNRLDLNTGRFMQYRRSSDDPHSIRDNRIYSVYRDRAGVLWVGTVTGGLNRLVDAEDGRFTVFRAHANEADSLSENSVWPLYEDRAGALWVGTVGGGLNRLNREREAFTRYRFAPNDSFSLSHDRVLSISEDQQGDLWVGTMGGGLNRMDKASERFYRYTEQDGLADNNAVCILPDNQQYIWTGTSNGLSRFDLRTKAFINYDEGDGLPSSIFNAGACYASKNGEFFFGTAAGFISFFPEQLTTDLPPPHVVLTGFDVFNRPAPLDTSITYVKQIVLPYNQNFVAFRAAALDYTNPAKNRYAYMLEGLDDRWIDAGVRRYMSYPNLAPGRYTFRVRAANSHGVWSEQEAIMHLIITPPFWQRWWFRLGMVVLFIGIVAALYQYRVHHLLKVKHAEHEARLEVERAQHEVERTQHETTLQIEKLRGDIAADFHDGIGSDLGGLGLELDLLLTEDGLTDALKKQIIGLRDRVEQISDVRRDMTWLVNTQHDYLEHLIDRIKQVAYELVPDGRVRVMLPEEIPALPIGMVIRGNIFFLVKEAIYNAARHSKADCITVSIALDAQTYTFTVKDDGIGFKEQDVVRGDGLNNMAMRAAAMGAELHVKSQLGEGTAIKFSVKMADLNYANSSLLS